MLRQLQRLSTPSITIYLPGQLGDNSITSCSSTPISGYSFREIPRIRPERRLTLHPFLLAIINMEDDQEILKEYPYNAYLLAPDLFKTKLEATLLVDIVGRAKPRLDDRYLKWQECSDLISKYPSFRDTLIASWKDGSFDRIRKSGNSLV
jgi:hypothetical protein